MSADALKLAGMLTYAWESAGELRGRTLIGGSLIGWLIGRWLTDHWLIGWLTLEQELSGVGPAR